MDFKIEILIKDVAEGDVKDFVSDISNEYGEQFDAGRGQFDIRTSRREDRNSSWFPTDFYNHEAFDA